MIPKRTPYEKAQLALYAAAAAFAGSGYAIEAHRVALERAAAAFIRERGKARVRGWGETSNTRRRIAAQRKACGMRA